MKKNFALCAFVCFLGLVRAQVVNTLYGPVQGFTQDGIAAFLGIPFASPPVDALRWKPPVPLSSWTEVRPALTYPPECPQKSYAQNDTVGTIIGEEDCLYLNVWTPDLNGSLPVMVFIHGGGNQQGSTGQTAFGARLYEGKLLAQRGGVVVVTVQYRLGALGNLVHPGLEEESTYGKAGNYGTLDLLAALQWVQQNIAAFGGSPERVTIFGESAGGVNVGNLMVMPAAKGLFHRAIIQSATPRLKAYAVARSEGIAFAQKLGAAGTPEHQVAFLRALPPDSLVRDDTSPISSGIAQGTWQPVQDGYWFPQMPMDAIRSGQHHRVPLLIGSNSEEMSLNVPLVFTPAMLQAFVQSTIPLPYRQQVLALYPPGTTNEQARTSYVALVSDAQFTSTTRRVANCVSHNQAEPVWRYFFTFSHTVPLLAPFGAYHGMELFYVFNTWEKTSLGSGPFFSLADDSMQQLMVRYWTNFARTGDPNGGDLAPWPRYDGTMDCYMELKAAPNGQSCGLRTAECNLWDQIVGFVPCVSVSSHEIEEMGEMWSLYPNPAGDRLHWNGPADPTAQVQVYDALGRLWREGRLSQGALDLSGLSPGLYLVRISGQAGLQVEWFVRQ